MLRSSAMWIRAKWTDVKQKPFLHRTSLGVCVVVAGAVGFFAVQTVKEISDYVRFSKLTKAEIQDRCTDLGFCKVVGFDLRCHKVDDEGKLQATEQVMDVAGLICGGGDPSAASSSWTRMFWLWWPSSGLGVATERALSLCCLRGYDGVLAGVDGTLVVTLRRCIEDTETGKVNQLVHATTVRKNKWAAPRLTEVWLRDKAPNTHCTDCDIAVLRFESPLFPDKNLSKAPLRVRSARKGEELCAITRSVISYPHDLRFQWTNLSLLCTDESEHVSCMRESFGQASLGTAAWSSSGELVAICASVESRYYR